MGKQTKVRGGSTARKQTGQNKPRGGRGRRPPRGSTSKGDEGEGSGADEDKHETETPGEGSGADEDKHETETPGQGSGDEDEGDQTQDEGDEDGDTAGAVVSGGEDGGGTGAGESGSTDTLEDKTEAPDDTGGVQWVEQTATNAGDGTELARMKQLCESLMERVAHLESDSARRTRVRTSTRAWMAQVDLTQKNTCPKL